MQLTSLVLHHILKQSLKFLLHISRLMRDIEIAILSVSLSVRHILVYSVETA